MANIKSTKDALKVKSAWLHQALTWPGGPVNAEKSLHKAKFKSISMYYLPQGLVIEDNKGNQCLVPTANVANLILEDKIEL